jgi:hypothetical protein
VPDDQSTQDAIWDVISEQYSADPEALARDASVTCRTAENWLSRASAPQSADLITLASRNKVVRVRIFVDLVYEEPERTAKRIEVLGAGLAAELYPMATDQVGGGQEANYPEDAEERAAALEAAVSAHPSPPSVAVIAEQLGWPVLAVAEAVGAHYWLFLAGDLSSPENARIEADGD